MEYINEIKKAAPINIIQTASVTKALKGIELVDMENLKNHGAGGFTDDGLPLMDPALVLEAMLEAKRLKLPLSFHEEDPRLIGNPGINEGKISDLLKIKGASHLAEDVMVARDCMLALTTGARVNFQHISSGPAVDIIRWAKAMGADIAAEASPQSFFNDGRGYFVI